MKKITDFFRRKKESGNVQKKRQFVIMKDDKGKTISTTDIQMYCPHCHSKFLFIVPLMLGVDDVEKDNPVDNMMFPNSGTNRSRGIFFGMNNKICNDCKTVYLWPSDEECWIFKKDWWKKSCNNIEDTFKAENELKTMHAFSKKTQTHEETKKCGCGCQLSKYNYECPECGKFLVLIYPDSKNGIDNFFFLGEGKAAVHKESENKYALVEDALFISPEKNK